MKNPGHNAQPNSLITFQTLRKQSVYCIKMKSSRIRIIYRKCKTNFTSRNSWFTVNSKNYCIFNNIKVTQNYKTVLIKSMNKIFIKTETIIRMMMIISAKNKLTKISNQEYKISMKNIGSSHFQNKKEDRATINNRSIYLWIQIAMLFKKTIRKKTYINAKWVELKIR